MLKRTLVFLYFVIFIEMALYVYLTLVGVQNMFVLVAGVELIVQLLVVMGVTRYYWRRKDLMKKGGV